MVVLITSLPRRLKLGDRKGTKFCVATDHPFKIFYIATASEYPSLSTLGEYLQLANCFFPCLSH